jgi:hypothetical protein
MSRFDLSEAEWRIIEPFCRVPMGDGWGVGGWRIGAC